MEWSAVSPDYTWETDIHGYCSLRDFEVKRLRGQISEDCASRNSNQPAVKKDAVVFGCQQVDLVEMSSGIYEREDSSVTKHGFISLASLYTSASNYALI